jgi:hypothetical protein
MAQPYRISKWNGPDIPTEADIVARLTGEGTMPVLRAVPPGYRGLPRRRAYAITVWVITGILAVQFHSGTAADRAIILRPGDRIDVQPNTTTSVSVPGSGYVTYAEVTPFRLPMAAGVPSVDAELRQRSA